MASMGQANVVGLRRRSVDFQHGRAQTTWAWSCECNDDALPEATGAASCLLANKASLRVRVAHLAARNQAHCL